MTKKCSKKQTKEWMNRLDRQKPCEDKKSKQSETT